MRPKPVPGRPSSTEVLRKLKSQESTPVAKPFVPHLERPKPTTIMEDRKIVVKEIDPTTINAEKILKRVEDVERKAKHGENYLSFYADIKYLEEQFIKATENLEKSNDTAIQRLWIRREAILRKRSLQPH